MSENHGGSREGIKYEEAKNNKWRLLIYRILLLGIVFINIKYDMVERIGFIPTMIILITLVIIISHLLTLIFKFFLK